MWREKARLIKKKVGKDVNVGFVEKMRRQEGKDGGEMRRGRECGRQAGGGIEGSAVC